MVKFMSWETILVGNWYVCKTVYILKGLESPKVFLSPFVSPLSHLKIKQVYLNNFFTLLWLYEGNLCIIGKKKYCGYPMDDGHLPTIIPFSHPIYQIFCLKDGCFVQLLSGDWYLFGETKIIHSWFPKTKPVSTYRKYSHLCITECIPFSFQVKKMVQCKSCLFLLTHSNDLYTWNFLSLQSEKQWKLFKSKVFDVESSTYAYYFLSILPFLMPILSFTDISIQI